MIMSTVQIRSKKQSMIRPSKSTTGAALAIIGNDWITVQLSPEEVTAGGLRWRAIQWGNISGFIAMTDNVEIREAPTTEDIYSVNWDGFEWTGTKEQLARERELVEGLMLTILAQFDAPTLFKSKDA